MIKTIIVYCYELNYNEDHIASFISKVVHDLFSFRHEVLALNAPRLRQVGFGYLTTFLLNLLFRMRRNDHSCPSGINIVQN